MSQRHRLSSVGNAADGPLCVVHGTAPYHHVGNLATGGDLVFQGVGVDFYALEARSGKQVFNSTLKSGSQASAMTYEVNGRQYVSIVATNAVVTFGLPAEAVK